MKKEDLLYKDGHFLGGWKNSKDGKFYLDISVVDNDIGKALERALQNDQIAIFDLSNRIELNTLDTIKSQLTEIFKQAKKETPIQKQITKAVKGEPAPLRKQPKVREDIFTKRKLAKEEVVARRGARAGERSCRSE